jgi:hypothetical protein
VLYQEVAIGFDDEFPKNQTQFLNPSFIRTILALVYFFLDVKAYGVGDCRVILLELTDSESHLKN